MQFLIHYSLHLIFPIFIALAFFRDDWKRAYIILLATMLVDLDHLIANPIFQADRCSINFHPLHSYPAIIIYCLMLFLKKPFNIIAIGLIFHMITDFNDCVLTYLNCKKECLNDPPIMPLIKTIEKLF